MKTILHRSLFCLLPLFAARAHAQFSVSDDFTDPARDILKWGAADEGSGDAEWIEASGKMNFVTPGALFSQSVASRFWHGLSPGTTNDWQAGVDVQLASLSLLGEDGVVVGLSAGNAAQPDRRLTISLQFLRPDFDTSYRALTVEVPGGGAAGISIGEPTTASSAQLRLNYDANSHMLLAGVVGAGNVVRTVGAWNTASWGMDAASQFEISVDGLAYNTATSAGQMTVDNFFITELPARSIGTLAATDDFNDSSRNVNNWGKTDAYVGVGALAETNSVVRYFTLGDLGSELDSATRLWSSGAGEVGKSWTAQVDVALPNLALGEGGEVEIGLAVQNLANPGDRATIGLDLSSLDGATLSRRFASHYEHDGLAFPDLDGGLDTTSQSAAVRARWDAPAQTLNLEYDADGAVGGYSWTVLKSYSVGSGNSDWGMGSNGRFQVGLFGRSYRGTTVPVSANVRLDNFSASTVKVAPIKFDVSKLSGKKLQLQWAGGVGPFQVQRELEVNTGAWVDLGAPVTVPSATVDATLPHAFFRIVDKGQ